MRQRMIKPEFFHDDRLCECSLSARLVFISTWCVADDQGNLERSAKQLRRQAFPDNTDAEVEAWLCELLAQGLLIEYAVDGSNYLHIKGFEKHQRIDRPSKPRCPDFEISLSTQRGLSEDSASTRSEVKRKEVKEREERERESNRIETQTQKTQIDDPSPSLEEWIRYFSVHGDFFGLTEQQWEAIWQVGRASGWRNTAGAAINWKSWGSWKAKNEKDAQMRQKQKSGLSGIAEALQARQNQSAGGAL